MIVITPSPPVCISINITICPKTLHVEKVGSVTSPVTQVEVVAINSASIYGTAVPSVELMGSAKRILPINITKRKLNNIIWVVVNLILFIPFLSTDKYRF